MNSMVQEFKGDIFNSMFRLFGKIYMKVTGIYAIYYLITMIVAIGLFSSFFGMGDLMLGQKRTHEEMQQIIEGFRDLITSPGFWAVIFLVIVFFGFLQSWIYYFAYNLANKQILTAQSDFRTCFKESFHIKVLKIFGISILFMLIFGIGGLLVGMSIYISGFLTFLLSIALFIFAFKVILVIPAMVIGNKSLEDSFAYSFNNITWFRALKLFGFSVIALILLIVVVLIVSVVAMLLATIPIAGLIFQFAFQIFIGSFSLSLVVAATLALYYRYDESIFETNTEGPENPGINE